MAGEAGLCAPPVRSLNFVGLTIRKISGILCVRITPSVTLIFDLLTLKLVRNIALVVGNLPTNFGVSTASVLELWTDTRQTGHVTL